MSATLPSAPALTAPAPASAPSPDTLLDFWRVARTLICDLFNLFGEPQAIAFQHTLTKKTRALMLTWLRAGETWLRHLLLIEAAALVPLLGPPASSRQTDARPQAGRMPAVQNTIEHHPDHPEDWRVSFRCFPQRTTRAHASRRTKTTRETQKPEWQMSFVNPETAARARANYAAWLKQMRGLNSSPASGGSGIRGANDEGGCADTSPASRSLDERANENREGGKQFFSAWPLAERAEAMLRVFNNPTPFARRLAFRLRRKPEDAARLLYVPDDIDRVVPRDTMTSMHEAAAPHVKTIESG